MIDPRGCFSGAVPAAVMDRVDVADSLGGVDVDNVFISREALSGDRIVFGINEPGGSPTSVDAIWIATSDVDPCAGDPLTVPALAPGGQLLLVALLAGMAVAGWRSAPPARRHFRRLFRSVAERTVAERTPR